MLFIRLFSNIFACLVVVTSLSLMAIAQAVPSLTTQRPTSPALENPSRQNNYLTRKDLDHQIKAVSDDGRLVAIDCDGRHFDILSTVSGEIVCRLPGFEDYYSLGHSRMEFASDTARLWLLSGAATTALTFVDSRHDSPTQRANSQLFARLKKGAGPDCWDLKTGERTRTLNTRNRVVVSFDVCRVDGTDQIAAIEIDFNAAEEDTHWISIYDGMSGTRLYTHPLPDFSGKAVSEISWLTSGRRFVLTNVWGAWAGIYDISPSSLARVRHIDCSPDLGHWTVESGVITPHRVFVLQRKNWEAWRVVAFDTSTGARVGQWIVGLMSEFGFDRSFPPMSCNRSGRLAIGGLEKVKYRSGDSTILLDTNLPNSKPQWVSAKSVKSFLGEEELLSLYGVYSLDGKLLRPFDTGIQPGDGTPVIPNTRVPRSVLASHQGLALTATDSELTFVEESTSRPVASVPAKRLLKACESESLHDLNRACAIYSPQRKAYVVAMPRRHIDLHDLINSLVKGKEKEAAKYTKSSQDRMLQQAVESVYGVAWDIVQLEGASGEAKSLYTTKPRTWVSVVEAGARLAVVSLSDHHEELSALFLDEANDVAARWARSNPRAGRRVAAILDEGRHFGWPWGSLVPSRGLCARANGDSIKVLCGLGTFTDGKTVHYTIDTEGYEISGEEIKHHQHSFTKHVLSSLDLAKEESVETASMIVQAGPIAITSRLEHDEVIALTSEPDRHSSVSQVGLLKKAIASNEVAMSLQVFRQAEKSRQTHTEERFSGSRSFGRGVYLGQKVASPDGLPWIKRWEVDDSGTFGWVGYGNSQVGAVIIHLPTLTQVARIMSPAPFAMTGNGRLLTDRGAIDLHRFHEVGLAALTEEPPPVDSRGRLEFLECEKEGGGTLYYLGTSGSIFADPNFPTLSYCRRDVMEIGFACRQRARVEAMGFRPVVLSANSIRSISVLERLAELVDTSEPQDTVVLAFATHGVRLQRGLYLVTPQTKAHSPQGTAVGWPIVAEAIKKMRARRVIVLLDTCHAESFSESSTDLLRQAQKDLEDRPGLTVLASTAAGEEAFELDEAQHGAFTHGLLSTLDSQGFPLTMTNEYFSRVTSQVAEKTNHLQTPVLLINNPLQKSSAPRQEK